MKEGLIASILIRPTIHKKKNGYITARFNEQVKNNSEKLDDDFMFQLTKSEFESLISKKIDIKLGRAQKTAVCLYRTGNIYANDCIKGRTCSETKQGFNTNV